MTISPHETIHELSVPDAAIDAHLGVTFPALALSVIHDGAVRLNAGWGWLDPEAQTLPTGPGSLFDLASVTKLFTTTAFLRLVAEGRVRLDDPLAAVVPGFVASGPRPVDGGMDPHTWEPLPSAEDSAGQMVDPALVTFRHLLTHTSGLAPWRDVFNAAGPPPAAPDEPRFPPRAARWANALAALCRYPFVGQPGGDVRYSDLGLMLLGEAVGRLYDGRGGVALAAAITDWVCEPLALSTLCFDPVRAGQDRHHVAPTELDARWRERRCWGEVHDENACGVGGVAGHAGLFGAALDVALLGQAWLDADVRLGLDPELVLLATREHARTGDVRRGLGWMLRAPEDASCGDLFGPATYGHTGFTGTSLWIDPDRRLVVACLTNRVYQGREHVGIHAFRRAIHDAIAQAVDG